MNKIILTLTVAFTFCAAQAQAEQYRVVGIMDGDTVKVLSPDNRQMKCRLFGVDAPEKNQAYGQQSKQSLSDLIFQKTVDVDVVDQDQYGRSVCRIFLNGVDVNKAQVQRGLAWWYRILGRLFLRRSREPCETAAPRVVGGSKPGPAVVLPPQREVERL